MGLRPPERDDLRQAAAFHNIELTGEELEEIESLMGPIFHGMDELEKIPQPPVPLKYFERDPGARPQPEDDPLNAILRRCSVKGAKSGKLAGKRVGVKDCVLVAGIPMSCGSLMLDGYIPDRDAVIVTRMLDAGAEIVAKLNMDNMAFAGTGDSSAFGPVLNPHNREFLSGGSSGGSAAALYYDDIDLTIGGDQGGSIRIPSAWCGTVGLKPTHGLVPYTDIIGIDPTIDHTGPMARSVADAALLLEVIADKVPASSTQAYTQSLSKSLSGLKIGVVKEGFGWDDSEPDVDAAVRRACNVLGELGARVEEISIPIHRRAGRFLSGVTTQGLAAMFYGNGHVHHVKGTYNGHLASALGQRMRAQANDLPMTLKINLLLGTYLNRHYPGRIYARTQNLRGYLQEQYDLALRQVDVLAMPTTPAKAVRNDPKLGKRELLLRGWRIGNNTPPFDVTGHPSLSVPCAKSDGLPIGLMLTGRHFEDATLLHVAYAYEQHVNWEQF